MSYFGVDRLVQHSKTINVNVSQSTDKKVFPSTFRTINVKAAFSTAYVSNTSASSQTANKTVNVKNTLTSPASGDVNLAFSTMYVKSDTSLSYGQQTKLINTKRTLQVSFKNASTYNPQSVTTLLSAKNTIFIGTNNSNQVLTLAKNKNSLLPVSYKNPPLVLQNVDFSDGDIWG